ncbi:hypothetical protein Q7C36_006348 [Tachysurus vachellii]|uniref:Rho-GAP domain-containing protein n=1 Tax=Tachysurus vachellii TaxID=175792 RepID=A0AA88SZF1_TACVA|nr:hypothetical protein Q7C36_006348 [Tachysurus vachellii]
MFRFFKKQWRRRDKKAVEQHMLQMVVTDMKECRLEKKRTEMGEALLDKVAKLDATLASDLNDWKQDMCETNSRLQQKIAKLQASLKLCEKQVKTKNLEIENLTRDQKQLEKHIVQLKVTLASVQEQMERDKKIRKDMEIKNNILLLKVTELQNSLLAFEEWEHLAMQEAGSLLATQYNMEKRIAQLETTLALERMHQEKQKERVEEYVTKLEKLVAVLKTTLPLKN